MVGKRQLRVIGRWARNLSLVYDDKEMFNLSCEKYNGFLLILFSLVSHSFWRSNVATRPYCSFSFLPGSPDTIPGGGNLLLRLGTVFFSQLFFGGVLRGLRAFRPAPHTRGAHLLRGTCSAHQGRSPAQVHLLCTPGALTCSGAPALHTRGAHLLRCTCSAHQGVCDVTMACSQQDEQGHAWADALVMVGRRPWLRPTSVLPSANRRSAYG